ncbi:Os10g0125600, partial [Oryza sativa Japonica Group]
MSKLVSDLTMSAVSSDRVVTMTVLPLALVFLNGAKNLSHLYSLSHGHISSKMSKNLLDCSLRSTSVWSCSRLCGSLSLP